MAGVAPAAAETAANARRVSYADLNLHDQADAAILLRRLDRAAQRACGDHHGRMPLRERVEIRRCAADAVEQAVAALNQPTLTALFNGESVDEAPLVVAGRQ